MKRANSDSLVAGFSLIEAMATLALTATIILALSSVAGQWLPNWRRGFVDLQRADLLGVGLERLVDDLSAAEYVTRSAGAPAPLFEGDASSVMFVRSAIGPDAYPHLEVVRLAEIKEDRGLAMVRTRARFAPTAPPAPGARRRLSPSAILSPSFARPSTFRSPMQDQTVFGFRVGKVGSSCPRRCGYRSGTRSPTGCWRRRPWLALGSLPPARPSLKLKRMRPTLFLRPDSRTQQ